MLRSKVFVGACTAVAGTATAYFTGVLDPAIHYMNPSFNLMKPVEFYACEDSKFYPGHGPEALNTDTLDDYLAAVEARGSSICFRTKEASVINNLKLAWYSKDEAPKFIEIQGIKKDGETQNIDVVWPRDKPVETQVIDSQYYSDFAIPSQERYTDFRVNYISGAKQNRLLLRAASPFFTTAVSGNYQAILNKTHEISQTAPYGMGLASTSAQSMDELADELRSKDSLHCGNYSYLMVYDLAKKYSWKAIGAISNLTAHTVVEVDFNEEKFTVDPTLGVVYPCTYSAMQAGKCDFSKAMFTDTYNPILWRYSGKNFYPDAKINASYSNLQDFYNDYQKL